MAVSLTSAAVSAMVGVLIGFYINEMFGGRRSSIGVHRPDGRLLPFWKGVIFFAFITVLAGTTSTIIGTMLADVLPGLLALLFSLFWVSVFLNAKSYSR